MSQWTKTIGFLLISTLLTHLIPFAAFFKSINTLIHEFGHAIVTLLLSGRVYSIHLLSDHSGVTYTSVTHDWKLIPIALAGYTTASLVSILLFYVFSRHHQKMAILLLAIFTAVSLLLFVRNSFGITWCISFMTLNVILFFIRWKWVQTLYYLLIAFICLVESVLSTITLVILSLTNPAAAGDAANLSRITHIPAVFWALFMMIIALICARYAMKNYFSENRSAISKR